MPGSFPSQLREAARLGTRVPRPISSRRVIDSRDAMRPRRRPGRRHSPRVVLLDRAVSIDRGRCIGGGSEMASMVGAMVGARVGHEALAVGGSQQYLVRRDRPAAGERRTARPGTSRCPIRWRSASRSGTTPVSPSSCDTGRNKSSSCILTATSIKLRHEFNQADKIGRRSSAMWSGHARPPADPVCNSASTRRWPWSTKP